LRGARVKKLRRLHERLAALTGNTPTRQSWRRIKGAHRQAIRAGVRPVEAVPAVRM
jgi:hypothetical protein